MFGQAYNDLTEIISIHAPREGSDRRGQRRGPKLQISIHAPREGSDSLCKPGHTRPALFLSTLPVRGATVSPHLRRPLHDISIHAPREGSDGAHPAGRGPPHPFLSTLPVRGATVTLWRPRCSTTNFYPRSP